MRGRVLLLLVAVTTACGGRAHPPGGHDAAPAQDAAASELDAAASDSGHQPMPPSFGNCVIEAGSACPDEAPFCCEWVAEGDQDHVIAGGCYIEDLGAANGAQPLVCSEIRDECDQPEGPDCASVDADGDDHSASWCGGDDCADDDDSIRPGAADMIEADGWLVEPWVDVNQDAHPPRIAINDRGDEAVLYATGDLQHADLWILEGHTLSWDTHLLYQGSGLADAELAAGPERATTVAFVDVDQDGRAQLMAAWAPTWVPFPIGELGAADGDSRLVALVVDGADQGSILTLRDGVAALFRKPPDNFQPWGVESPIGEGALLRGLDLAAAPDGTLHIAAVVGGDLFHFTDASGAWTAELVDCVLGIRQPSIAVDGDGHAHIAYVRWTESELWYATNASGSFVREPITSLGGTYKDTPELAVATDGTAHLLYAWYAPPFPRRLRYAHRLVDGWSSMAVAPEVGTYAITATDDVYAMFTLDDPSEDPISTAQRATRSLRGRVDQNCDGVDGDDLEADGWADEE